MSISDFAARLAHDPIPPWLAACASWTLVGYAFVTGYDLIHPPAEETPRSLLMVERVATLHTWGVVFLVAGGVLALGLLASRHVIVWLGHVACFAFYLGFAGATLQAVWQYQHSPAAAAGGYIWRAAYLAFMVAVGHGALAIARGAIPRRGEA